VVATATRNGSTFATQYARQGITLRLAKTDRVNGWADVLCRLGDLEAGIAPALFIHRRWGRLVETKPALRAVTFVLVKAETDSFSGFSLAAGTRTSSPT